MLLNVMMHDSFSNVPFFFPSQSPLFFFFLIIIFYSLGAPDPTYLKEPQDKFVAALAIGALFVGVSQILSGLYSMANGTNKL
jgi:hypothetical protein